MDTDRDNEVLPQTGEKVHSRRATYTVSDSRLCFELCLEGKVLGYFKLIPDNDRQKLCWAKAATVQCLRFVSRTKYLEYRNPLFGTL